MAARISFSDLGGVSEDRTQTGGLYQGIGEYEG
jgi:hypothetical protein